jgi:PAS domain S-box-containing protein
VATDPDHIPLGDEFRRLADRSPDGMAMLRGGTYVYANAAWANGLQVDDGRRLVGRPFLDHALEEDRPALEQWLQSSDGGQDRMVAEYRFAGEQGRTAVLQITRVRLAGEGFEPTVGVIGRDVTRMKQTQASLLLADRMMSVGALAAGTAHEINNPLTYVQGNISFVLEELRTMREQFESEALEDLLEALDEAHEGAERVRVIVKRLHAFSRADQEELRRIDVNKVINDAVNMAYTEIRHRARLYKELNGGAVVLANEARLGQVVLNLLLNAAHALPEGRAEQNFIRVTSRMEDSNVLVSVEDSGPGIPKEIVGRVFDPFFTTKPMGVGTGLGLSIAHSITCDLGGRLEVSSELGVGTRFTARLPACDADADGSQDLEPVERAPDRRARVLVIDDEPLIAAALKRALREHLVEVASNGRIAIEVLRERGSTFDLVFCDLMMPDLTGMDVYAWTGENMPGVEDRFVFMTGGIFTPRAQEFLDRVRSHNVSIEKPFDLETIRRFVHGRVSRGSTA